MKQNNILSKFGWVLIMVVSFVVGLWNLTVCLALSFINSYGGNISLLAFFESFFDLIVATYFILLGINYLKGKKKRINNEKK